MVDSEADGERRVRSFSGVINAPVLPDLSLPPVVFKSAGFPPKAQTVRYNATASDACGASVPITCTPASGSVFPLGGTTVSCSATNASGTATGSFTVIVS